MNESDDFVEYPAEPGTETTIRYVKSHETRYRGDDLPADPPVWKINEVVAGFALERLLGSGVTSTVYKARELATGRTYALKLLRTRSQSTLTASRIGFNRMIQLTHPSLVRVYDVLRVGEHIGITMEAVDGKSLIEVINDTRGKDRAIVFDLAKRLLHDIGGALQTIHDAGLVHRDVKPDNVMIDHRGRARLIDYGLVGSYDPESDPDARRNYLAGTYWYMAPESISMQIYPPACDVYALGCIVLELIANRSHMPIAQPGFSLGQSIGDVRTFLPPDTPVDLADLLCDMIDPEQQNRPLAARLAQVWRQDFPFFNAASTFRGVKLHGRENEMAVAERWVQTVVSGRPTRLHISGESGIGKSWFLSELKRRIRSNAWFQVFDATCRERADVPLQAFDTIADAIARRYAREDRDKIRLQPRHAMAIRQAFPALRSVIFEPTMSTEEQVELRMLAIQKDSESAEATANRIAIERSDALLAGVALVEQMCDYGPVFLIVDDIQWADQDSLNVIDKLISDAEREVGIISVGRDRSNQFQRLPDCHVELHPLNIKDSFQLLRQLLCTGEFQWSDSALLRLAALGEGNAYRLTQLAACVGYDDAEGWHHRLQVGNVEIEDIWKSRLDRISDDARVAIEYLAIAGGPIRPLDLAKISQLAERCGDAVRELVDLRLVMDEFPKRDAIEIIHERIARRVVAKMDDARCRSIHQKWSTYLRSCAENPWRAARIAGHLIAAEQTSAAIPFMVQAAFDAESRFAFTEAAKWHLRISSHFSGSSSSAHLWRSVICFEKAGRPLDAAAACREMGKQLDRDLPSVADLQFHYRLAMNLIQSGSFKTAIDEIQPIISIGTVINATAQKLNRIDVTNCCVSLSKQMLTLDFLGSLKLMRVARSNATDRRGSRALGLLPAVLCLAARCRNSNSLRQRNTMQLQRITEAATLSDDLESIAQSQQGIALRNMLACDWSAARAAADAATDVFRRANSPDRSSESLTYLPHLWSRFYLGRLQEFKTTRERLVQDVHERNDEFLRQVVHSGLGAAAFLIDDDEPSLRRTHRSLRVQVRGMTAPHLQFFHGFASILGHIYESRLPQALRVVESLSRKHQSTVQRMQLLRILMLTFEGHLQLRLGFHFPIRRNASLIAVNRVCQRLRQEPIAYANLVATFFNAQAAEISGDKIACLALYRRTVDIAGPLDQTPIRLAAIDRLELADEQKDPSELRSFLKQQGVKNAEKFARLYCGLTT